jgi:hypothetical protein
MPLLVSHLLLSYWKIPKSITCMSGEFSFHPRSGYPTVRFLLFVVNFSGGNICDQKSIANHFASFCSLMQLPASELQVTARTYDYLGRKISNSDLHNSKGMWKSPRPRHLFLKSCRMSILSFKAIGVHTLPYPHPSPPPRLSKITSIVSVHS